MNAKLIPAADPTCIALAESDRATVTALLNAGAGRVEQSSVHWVIENHQYGESIDGVSYCRQCAENKLAELLKLPHEIEYCVEGGYGIEGTSHPFCGRCQTRLSNSFTNYICRQQVALYLEHGFDPTYVYQCLDLSMVISSRGWEPWKGRLNLPEKERIEELEYYTRLNHLCRLILTQFEATRAT